MTAPMTVKSAKLRLAISTTLASGLLFVAAPAWAQNLPDTGNVTNVNGGLGGAVPTTPVFTPTPTPTGTNLQVDLRNNRTILNWGGTGFNIAAGNSVNFKDSRATSGVTNRVDNIAVLNRSVAGYFGRSTINGALNSDPNVAVYIINTGGILFGPDSAVNVGGLLASSLDLTDDNDFLNASSTLRFAGSSGNRGAFVQAGGREIRTATSTSTSGGRIGDVIIVGDSALAQTATISASGDFAAIAASDVTIQASAGSPLSFTINAGSRDNPIGNGLVSANGNITARNITLVAVPLSGGAQVAGGGVLNATGASATDRGVVLTAGANAPGVTMPSGPGGNVLHGGTINSAKDIFIGDGYKAGFSADSRVNILNAAGQIDLPGGSIAIGFYADGAVTADRIVLHGQATFAGLVKTTGGGLTFNHDRSLAFSGGMDIAGDVTGTSGGFFVGGRDVKIGGSVNVTAGGGQYWRANTQVGGSVTLSTDGPKPFESDSGDITIGNQIGFDVTSFSAGGSIKLSGPGQMSLQGNVTALGNLELSGRTILIGNTFASLSIKATGAVLLTAGSGGFLGGGNSAITTVQSNSDSIGGEGVTVDTTGAISQRNVKYMAGPARQGDVRLRWGAGRLLLLGGVAGRELLTATGSAAYASGIANTGAGVELSDVDVTNSLSITGQYVNGSNYKVANGNLTLAATNGNLTVSSINASGAVDLRAAPTDPSGSNDFGQIIVRNLDAGADAFLRGRLIEISNSSIGGSLTLQSTGYSLIGSNLSQSHSTNTIGGALTITAGNEAVLRNDITVGGDLWVTADSVYLGSAGNFEARQQVKGAARIIARSGDITLQAGLALSGPDVVLSTPAAFKNLAGANAVTATGTFGHWVIYSATPANNTFGGLDSHNTALWNSTLATRAPDTISGNRYVFALAPTLTFRPVNYSKVYGFDFTNTNDATLSQLFTVTGYQPGVAGAFLGDTAATAYQNLPTITSAGLAERASVLGGPYALTLALNPSLVSNAGYVLVVNNSSNAKITVTPKPIDVRYVADSKTYDGTRTATGQVLTDGVLVGDNVTISGTSWIFADKNAGVGKAVSVAGTVFGGSAVSNYSFILPTGAITADIRKLQLGGVVNVNNKTYDGTDAATGTVTTNKIDGDDVAVSNTVFRFSDKNAGISKLVFVMGTLTGLDAGNYTFDGLTGHADILKKALTGTITANNKTYDGTTGATGTIALAGVLSGDSVGTNGTILRFADKNAGTGKAVSAANITLSGADGGNYSLASLADTTADILKKALTGFVVANNKTYDGTAGATGSVTLTGVVQGDSIGTTGSVFSFADKNAGTGKSVTVAGTALSGADAGNYTLGSIANGLADILKKALTGTVTANSKTYDGTRTGSGSVVLSGVVSGDAVGTTGTVFTFSDKNAGTAKTVAVTGTTLNGADAANYTFTLAATATADILKKALTGAISANSKTYDGTAGATGSIVLSGVVSGDTVGTTGTVLAFADKNAGTGKTVSASGTTLTGADAGNYTLSVSTGLADILKRSLTGTVNANSKTYDGTNAATGSVSISGVLQGDDVSAGNFVLTFADKNAGAGKTVSVAGALSGADAGNYSLSGLVGSADIFKKALTGAITASSKVYDGTTSGTGTVTLSGVISGDAVGTTGSAFTFADKNAGTGKTVTVSGTILSGADAGNYTLSVAATAVADIFKKALTGNATINSKTYDGTTSATGTLTLSGVVAGETVGTTGSAFAFADKNAGAGKTVNVTGTTLTGADAANYTLSAIIAVGDILKKSISGSVAANTKTYDGTTSGSGTVTLSGVIAGDTVGTTGSVFTFANKNAGTGKTVTVTGTTLNGADAGNYTLTLPTSALADILRKSITGSITVTSRQYDGTTAGSGTVTLNGVVSGDAVGTTGTIFTFSDKNAGAGKTVTVSGTTLNGADAGNYTLTPLPGTALGEILRRVIAVAADDKSKTNGDPDPLLTFTITSGSLVSGDSISGLLSRAAGENPGSYAISIGTLSAGGNYQLNFTPGLFTIQIDPASQIQQTLKAIPLPSQIQGQSSSGSAVTIDKEALCEDDKACTAQ